ncbi:MAG: DUF350 domain-containing protein [Planctomycetes bacterium]|nr:DUF350 domain-containing protein [Planctomycetota bacterium]
MGETMAWVAVVATALLAFDAAVGRLARRGDESTPARRMVQGARVFALFLLAATLVTRCRGGETLLDDALCVAGFGVAGALGLLLAQRIGFAVLRGLRAAVDAGNLAAGVAAGAHTAAIGILIANATGGTTWTELGIAAIAFVVGQATLLLLVALFRWLTSYDDPAQILGGNTAAALSHGGLTIAIALVVAHASDGEFQGTWPAVRDFGIALAESLVLWPLRQLLVQCVLLRGRPSLTGGPLDRAIERGDVGAGALEGTTYVALALLLRSLA